MAQRPNTTVRYFAWVRARLDRAQDTITLPEAGMSLRAIADMLTTHSEAHHVIFSRPEALKASINKEYAALDAVAKPGDDVAFFPPVTGG